MEVATESCSVVVRGSEERLEDISASQLRIVADLSNVMTDGLRLRPSQSVSGL